MAKPEWGTKRTCPSCGGRFYDLKRSPIRCPKCDSEFEADMPVRTHRAVAAAAGKKPKAAALAPAKVVHVAVPIDEDVLAVPDDADDADMIVEGDDGVVVEDEDEEDDALMEDASDLGGDDEDMAEVMEHLDGDREP